MADENQTDAAPKTSNLKLILIAVVGAVVLVAGAVGTTVLLLRGGTGEATANTPAEPTDATPYYVELLDPKFAVNLAAGSRAKFLKVSMTALTFDPDVDSALRDHMPQLRSNLMLVLSSQKSQNLSDRQGRESLQKKTLDKIRTTLSQVGVEGSVEEVYFTSFVMQ